MLRQGFTDQPFHFPGESMFKRTSISTGVLISLGSALLAPLAAQGQETQRIEITGSAIKRTSVEGPAPVEVITRKDIERTGATNINELLRAIPSVDIFDQGELSSNSPAGSGTASVRLRGLSESEVLVLLNGRRLPVNALYDSSGAGAAFDINSLPIGAIERVDILKDGASAIYGADAVAGVINFITKTDYQGIEATASYGRSSRSDGEEKRIGLSAGFGDLSKDRFNVLLGLDVFKREPILRKDRELTRSVNFTRFGGTDARSSFAPTGNVINPNTGGFVALPYKTCPPEALQVSLNRCRYDFNASLLTAYNGADRVSALAVANFQLTPSIKAFAEVTASTSKDTFRAHPVPDFFIVPIIDPAQLPYEILDANGDGTGTVYIAGRFMQGGPRTTKRKSDFLNGAVGLEGSMGGYDWKVNLSRGISKVTNNDSNYYNANLWVPATGSGQLDPTVNTNDPAFVESLKVRPTRKGESELSTLGVQLNGELMKLPAGPIQFAVGAQTNRETLVDTPDPLSQQGLVIGSIGQAAVDAKRDFKAVFAELAIPVTKDIEGQLAVRHDRYSNASATSPKIAAKWNVTPTLAVRGSFTRSFRAPVLKQLFGAQEEGAINITDPDLCTILGVTLDAQGQCDIAAFQVNGSNPGLKPEKGKTFNFGVIFEASKNVSASFDVWKINKTDDISTPTIATAIEQGLFNRTGARYNIFTNLQNIAERKTAGADLDARVRLPGTPVGNVSIRNLLTYYHTNATRAPGDTWAEFNNTYATPRWRNGFNVTVENGPWTFVNSLRSVGGFWDTDRPYPIPVSTRKVSSHEEWDTQVSYSGFKSVELSFGIKNLLDNDPPFSLKNASDNTYSQMGFAELYTSRGRFFYASAKYVFR
jgi:iron complex outermembrane recepter protein